MTAFSLAALYNGVSGDLHDFLKIPNEYARFTVWPIFKPFSFLLGILHSAVLICLFSVPSLLASASNLNFQLRQKRLIPGLASEKEYEDMGYAGDYLYYPFQSNYKGYFGQLVYGVSFLVLLPLIAVGIPFYVAGKAVNEGIIMPIRDRINLIRYPEKRLVLDQTDLSGFFRDKLRNISCPDNIKLAEEKNFLTAYMRSNYQAFVTYTNFEKDLTNLINAYFAKEEISTIKDLQDKFNTQLTELAQSEQEHTAETLLSSMRRYIVHYRFPLGKAGTRFMVNIEAYKKRHLSVIGILNNHRQIKQIQVDL